MSEQARSKTVAIDEIEVEPSIALSGDVKPATLAEEIRAITVGLANQEPPTNALVVLKAARWWYAHGGGASDPVFRWAIEWTRNLLTDEAPDVSRYHEFLDYLVDVGFADDRRGLREAIE
jgi:hypothetical protein